MQFRSFDYTSKAIVSVQSVHAKLLSITATTCCLKRREITMYQFDARRRINFTNKFQRTAPLLSLHPFTLSPRCANLPCERIFRCKLSLRFVRCVFPAPPSSSSFNDVVSRPVIFLNNYYRQGILNVTTCMVIDCCDTKQ